jgi:putative membrane protein insertion efficiency factor
MNIFSIVFIALIRLYQKTLSPDHGWFRVYYPQGYCRFYPSCSQYSIDAIQKYGPFVGPIKGLWRIIRCNPWSKGGVDPA